MLDSETKSKIDSARDILVGKVPDPKSQVEQITIALIYKFMDDMDHQSEELGGKAAFFSGQYKRYAWSQLLDKRFSGHERLLLYAEGIEKMNENKNIPQLFRDIFKGVFLPYRDPETLNLFLKEINGFSYDHSERLGDAFEYLLSVMDSQGSAGQFRTPRHIIDFIVGIVDPKKNETILDPACGTAGFLISSYKHIISQNTKNRSGDQLTADERGRLMTTFCGYDISPDMVRLSRVNMYLHGFANPRIHEYDTLTSEERWDERYDVILANPPFMTPKGGIRPHNRFSIRATRSEVLFVDYIAEHLNVNGRAGVIVPEGIIFQSQNAYKKLRKMLIDNYLWCVVSLPAGCFNPYSGVKTSILLLDKSLVKRTDEILFVKVEHDGFDLGAQRRPIEKNDLPGALAVILRCHSGLDPESRVFLDSPVTPGKDRSLLAHFVPRKRILESADITLSGDRYRDSAVRGSTKWPMVGVTDLLESVKYTTKVQKSEFLPRGKYPIIDQSEQFISGYWNDKDAVFRVINPVILFGDHTRSVKYVDFDFVLGADGVKILKPNERVNPKFFYYLLANTEVQNLGYSRHYKELVRLRFPLPPLEVQEKIVAELDGYRKIIEGAKQVVSNYKPNIKVDPGWPKEILGNLAEIFSGGTPAKAKPEYWNGEVPWVSPKDMKTDLIVDTKDHISEKAVTDSAVNRVPIGTVLCVVRSGILAHSFPVALAGKSLTFNQDITGLVVDRKQLMPEWLFHVLRSMEKDILNRGTKRGGTVHSLQNGFLRELPIPLPSLDVQYPIVKEIEAERQMVEANRKLIEIFERKIQTKLAEIWGSEER